MSPVRFPPGSWMSYRYLAAICNIYMSFSVYKYICVCVYAQGTQILSQFEDHPSFALGLKMPNSNATQNK